MSLSRVFIDALRDMQSAMAGIGEPSFFHRVGTHYPTTDMIENEKSYELHAEVPGFDKKDIQIEVPNDYTVVLKGTMEKEHKMVSPSSRSGIPVAEDTNVGQKVATTATDDKEKQVGQATNGHHHMWVQERVSGSFFRSFHLPIPIDPKSIKASCNNGVLKVIIPKTDDKQTTRINIE